MAESPKKRSVLAQVLALVVFAALSAWLIAAFRAYDPAADPASEDLPQRPARRMPWQRVPTVASATKPEELLEALHAVFASNLRLRPLISAVSYDRESQRLHVAFALDHADPAVPGAKHAALRRARDILQAVRGSPIAWRRVLVTGTAETVESTGDILEATVLRAQFTRSKLDTMDWDRVTGGDIEAAAEQFWISTDFTPPLVEQVAPVPPASPDNPVGGGGGTGIPGPASNVKP